MKAFFYCIIWVVITTQCVQMRYLDQEKGIPDVLSSLEQKIKDLEAKVSAQDVIIDELRAKDQELEDHINNGIVRAQSDTLFLAIISTETQAISDDEVILWDSAPINPGGHFNTVLGAYTAPYSGYYQITITKRSNNNRSYFWLLVDNDRYLYNYLYTENAASNTGSVTINLELTAGQIIRVENDASSVIYGTDSAGVIQSWFTGFMLYAL